MRTIHHDPVGDNSGSQNNSNKYRLQIHQGGTGADNHKDAIENLGGVLRTIIDKPGGIAGLDSNGFINPIFIPSGVEYSIPVNIFGETTLEQGQSTILEITNYDSFTDYVVEFQGLTGYRDNEFIYVTAEVRGTGRVIVNGSHFPINSTGNMPINQEINGGVINNTITSDFTNAKTGTCIQALSGGKMAIGYPNHGTPSSLKTGLIEIYDELGAVVKQFKSNPGNLKFQASVEDGGRLNVVSDAPHFQPLEITESREVEVTEGASFIQLSGRGGKGTSTWKPKVSGTDKIMMNGVTTPSVFDLRFGAHDNYVQGSIVTERKVRILMEGLSNSNIAISNLPIVMTEQFGDGPITNRSITSSIKIELFKTTITVISKTILSKDFVYIDIIAPGGGETRVHGKFIGNTADASTYVYEFKNLRFVKEGVVPGHYVHGLGLPTKLEGHDQSLTWFEGLGAPEGIPVPTIKTTKIFGDYRIQLEFKYGEHPKATSAATLTTPFAASENNFLKPLTFGHGIDSIEREIQYSLIDKILGTTHMFSIGTIKVEFKNLKINIVLNMNDPDIWKDNPVSAKLVFVKVEGGNETRTEFDLAYVGYFQGLNFEVSDYSLQSKGVLESGNYLAEATTKTIKTVENNNFGNNFSFAEDVNILAVGLSNEVLTGRSQIVIVENYDQAPVRSFISQPKSEESYGKLGKIKLSSLGNLLIAGYPEDKNTGSVVFYKKADTGYEFYTRKLLGGIDLNANFGFALDCSNSGSLVVVGAPGANKVVLFSNESIVVELARIEAPIIFSKFGREVRVNEKGTSIAIGAINQFGQGVVLIYVKENNDWILNTTIQQPQTLPKEIDFGATFDLDSRFNMIAIGAPGNVSLIGRVLFFFNGTQKWEHYKTLGETVSFVGDKYGVVISVDDKDGYVLIGAPEDRQLNERIGKVYQYSGDFSFL